MPSDDELAQTATAPATPSAIVAAPRPTLGRFRIDAILGEGGMGVVHAAFDPELERKIALKVLRHAGSDDARARLLREARAMAKLSHPNVITVFEVGSADGQDFVAMELVDGETLGDWLQRTRPRPRAILAAFVAAGRGLAAAHAAGLVHRDFKPSNVLRSHAGGILVTDFGLARPSLDGEPAVAEPVSPGEITRTETGAIVGTPAYMAPEQWTGGAVSPATDQFAFCVALWEALAGERPFRGDTIEELRTGVLAGPATLAAVAIPRRLRTILRRGLAIDPAQRWQSMDALLATIERHARRGRRWIAGGASVVALAGIAAIVVITRDERASECPVAALDPAIVWSAERNSALAARDADAARLIDEDIAAWRTQRAHACEASAAVRSAKLACLDATLARIDAALGSVLADRGRIDADSIATMLVDPTLCDRPSPPRLARVTAELLDAFSLHRHALVGDPPPTADQLGLAEHASSPCARALALTARIESVDEHEADAGRLFRDLAAVATAAAQCDDDRIKTEGAIGDAFQLQNSAGLQRAEGAVASFPQDDLRAEIEVERGRFAVAAERWDDASAAFERAIELAGRRHRSRTQLQVVRSQVSGLLARGRPADLAKARQLYATWLPIARRLGPGQLRLEADAAKLRWRLGEVAAADSELETLRARGGLPDLRPPTPLAPPVELAGEVVDEVGAPVANASVTAGLILIGDAVTHAAPLFTMGGKSTRTDDDGKFSIAEARGMVIAQAGSLRSTAVMATPRVRLVVHPTSQLDGSVSLGDRPATSVWVVARGHEQSTIVVAPVLANGTFHLDGVPRGNVDLGVVPFGNYEIASRAKHLVISTERVTGLALATSHTRLHLIARSSDLVGPDASLIWIFAKAEVGEHPTLRALMKNTLLKSGLSARPVDLPQLPAELTGKVRGDDLLVTVPDRPDGELLVCGIGFAKKQLTSLNEYRNALVDLELGCSKVERDQTIVTIALPPLRKLGAR